MESSEMGCIDPSRGALILSPRESFQFGGLRVGLRSRRAGPCSNWKPYHSGACWRAKWISEKQGTKVCTAGSTQQRTHFEQRPQGFNLQNLKLNERAEGWHAEGIVYSALKRSESILKALGTTLFILGVGLSLSPPASARTVAPPVSEESIGDVLESASHGVKAVKEAYDAYHGGCDDSNHSTQHSTSPGGDTSGTLKDTLRLSEGFWSGIPTPEDSFLYRLKSQLDMNPSDLRALEALLEAVLAQQDMLRTLTIVETLLEVQPENWHWKLLKARTHESLGELSMAKDEYEGLLSLNPLSARFLQGLVMLLSKVGEQTQALELIKNALNQAISEGKDVEARDLEVLLGQFHIQLGNFEDALQHLNGMIEQDPKDHRPYLCQGLAYAFMNEMDKAKNSFQKYLDLCPPDALEQNHFDGLLLKAKASMRVDALRKAAMKGTFRNRKTSKPMKHPSLSGNWNPRQEEISK